MALPNIWHLRKVAEIAAKPCDICYKPTTSVFITPENKDFFYLCLGHTKDRGFCVPIIDEAEAAAKKKKAELEREIEAVKQEYEEKMKKKKKNKEKDKDKDKDEDKKSKEAEKEDEQAEKEKDDKIKAVENKDTSTANADETPRKYSLQKVFYQKRLDRLRNIEMAKRNQERMRNPNLFPAVPSGNPG